MKRAWDSSNLTDSSSDEDEAKLKSDLKNNFLSKISTMMYTFGDVKEPLEESVKLMYVILREQMDILLIEAEKAANLRKSNEISHKEILFLMRRNKAKLRQLLQYLEVLDTKPALLATNILMNEGGQPVRMNKVDTCKEFLASIEDCQEFTSLMEDETLVLPESVKKRLERRLLMIECMKLNEYEEFSKALQVSFYQKSTEFKKWLLQDEVTNFPLTELAVIIISFLARETIAEIVDRAFCIKSNKLKGIQMYNSRDPFDLPDALANVKTSLKKTKGNEVSGLYHLENTSQKEVGVFCKISSNDSVIENGQFYPKCLSDSNMDEVSDVALSSNASSPRNFHNLINASADNLTDAKSLSVPYYIEDDEESLSPPKSVSEYLYVIEDSVSAAEDTESSSDLASEASYKSENSFSHSLFQENSLYSDISVDEASEDQSSLTQTFQKSETKEDTYNPETEAVSDTEMHDGEKQDYSRVLSKGKEIADKSNTTSLDNSLEASNKEFLCRKAITPEEIRDAFVQFNEPSPLSYFFSNQPVRLKKKFCLAGSLEDS